MFSGVSKELKESLDSISSEAKGTKITELLEIPTPLEFMRDYVAKNIPVVIRGCALKWPAIVKWNTKYFRTLYPDKKITVAVTPNGLADGITKNESNGRDYFVMPEEQPMTFNDFIDKLDNPGENIYYIQRQNSNLTEDFYELSKDLCLDDLSFASQAFNKAPDAVNFWMGDERAVTSMHKDPYENIYCVISGYKNFILIPPTDLHNVPRLNYPVGTFATNRETNKMFVQPEFDDNKKERSIEWVSIDPLCPNLLKFPNYEKTLKYEIQINSGDILYLPSLWYHHVRQSHKCIAVNFWYDIDYDARFSYYRFIEKLCGFYNEKL